MSTENCYLMNIWTFSRGRSVSSEHDNSESEHSEKAPLVSTKLESLAKFLFSKSLLQDSASGTSATTSSSLSCNKQDNNSDSPTRFILNYFINSLIIMIETIATIILNSWYWWWLSFSVFSLRISFFKYF